MLHRILGIFIFVVSLLAAWGMMEIRHFADAPLQLPEEGMLYQLEKGASLSRLAADLENREVVESALLLKILARWEGQAGNLKAGEYRFVKGATPRGLLEQLVAGRVTTYSLTLVEGWTFRQLLSRLAGHEALKQTLEGLSDEEIMQQLGHGGEHPEGRFLSDTYHFPRGTTDLSVLQRAYDAMQHFLEKEWPQRDQEIPLKSPYEALILASIVERETAVPDERPMIAGVFSRRLKKRMRLQTDPTVIYGLGDTFDGDIRYRDLKADTPYNTYLHRGLPPTPISMPGREAVQAVLHPAAGDDLYFVSRGDGSHYFSATLEEHNRAVRKYQLKK